MTSNCLSSPNPTPRWAVIGVLAGVAGSGIGLASESITLDFETEVQNVRFLSKPFIESPHEEIGNVCADLTGELRYGRVPHRAAGESIAGTSDFLNFAVAYDEADTPRLVLDLDQDNELACGEEISLIAHPQEPDLMFRTLTLRWNDDAKTDRERRYRLLVPVRLEPETQSAYFVDLVDVPVARWHLGDQTSVWVLFDGNHDGVFDRRFADGVLVDTTGNGKISVDPYGGNFFSYHHPLELPWGAYRVAQIDPAGRSLTLEPAEAASLEQSRPFTIGDRVPGLQCSTLDRDEVTFAGASGRHQVLFFFLSNCGSCKYDLDQLDPLLREIGSTRLLAVGVSMDERREAYEDFLGPAPRDWAQCFSGQGLWDNALARRFDVRSPSSFVLLDPEGRFVARGQGVHELQTILGDVLPPEATSGATTHPDS